MSVFSRRQSNLSLPVKLEQPNSVVRAIALTSPNGTSFNFDKMAAGSHHYVVVASSRHSDAKLSLEPSGMSKLNFRVTELARVSTQQMIRRKSGDFRYGQAKVWRLPLRTI